MLQLHIDRLELIAYTKFVMIITYFGKQFFKIQHGDLVLAFNPISKESDSAKKNNLKIPKFGADITLVTINHPDYNGVENTMNSGKEPFIISGPGDYEIDGFFIKGLMSEVELQGKKYINTIYMITIDSINVCFFGALGPNELSRATREEIESADVVFVPIGNNGLKDAVGAHKFALSLEPKIIIPMDYGPEMEMDSLNTFLKASGEGTETVEKLTLKRKDLEKREADTIVLEY